MSWAVGYDGRWIGYGVPAICDQPDCGTTIDRGMAYRCVCCGLFFCGDHLYMSPEESDEEHHGSGVCDRCIVDENDPARQSSREPYDPTPDSVEWIRHQLTDPSWAAWRAEQRTSTLVAMHDRLAAESRPAWRDSQGDVWTEGADGLMHTRETAPFPREHVERKWGPLVPVESGA